MERQGDNFVITESASDSVWASVAARPGSVTTRVKISVQWIDSDTSRAYADSFWYILVLTPGDSDVPSDDPDTPIRRSVGGGENLPLPGLSLTLSLDAVFDGIDTAEYTPIFEEITRDEEMDVIVQPIQSELVFSTDNQFNDFYAPDLSEVFGSLGIWVDVGAGHTKNLYQRHIQNRWNYSIRFCVFENCQKGS